MSVWGYGGGQLQEEHLMQIMRLQKCPDTLTMGHNRYTIKSLLPLGWKASKAGEIPQCYQDSHFPGGPQDWPQSRWDACNDRKGCIMWVEVRSWKSNKERRQFKSHVVTSLSYLLFGWLVSVPCTLKCKFLKSSTEPTATGKKLRFSS